MLDGFVESGIGAIIGFFLAQIVNMGKIIRDWYNRPKFVVESRQENWILERAERHTVYGFFVRNKGRTIATGVRVQVVKILARHDGNKHYILSENAYDLLPYHQGRRESVSVPLTLFPGSSVDIHLASRNDYDNGAYEDVIYPSVSELPHLFEEIATGANEYIYTVVVFDDKANSSQKTSCLSLILILRRGCDKASGWFVRRCGRSAGSWS